MFIGEAVQQHVVIECDVLVVEQYNAEVDRYECQCVGGHVGARCESTSGCHHHPQPCHNGGQCVADSTAGLCLCPSGFTGRFCEVDVDDCASQPCVNGQYRRLAVSITFKLVLLYTRLLLGFGNLIKRLYGVSFWLVTL